MSRDSSLSNYLLAALPNAEYQRLEPYLTTISVSRGQVLYEASEMIETVYFPHDALISLVSILMDGSVVEVGLIGNTGVTGLPDLLSNGYSNHRAIVQLWGNVTKISASVLKREFDRGGELQRLLLNFVQIRIDQTVQLAICNRHHTIEERLASWLLMVRDLIQSEELPLTEDVLSDLLKVRRSDVTVSAGILQQAGLIRYSFNKIAIIEKRLARWLLMVRDLTQSDELPLTQEFLSNMLGVRRSGVTVSAGILQRAGLIRYFRGDITILDAERLKQTTCECYELFRDNFNRT